MRDHREMQGISSDPAHALAVLPPDQSAQIERQWLEDTLAWLKSTPPQMRTQRLRRLAEGICGHPGTKERFQSIWVKAFAPKLFAEGGLPEATSLPRELMARVKKRLLPQLEDELDLYAALQMTDLDDEDARWVASLSDDDVAPWRELLSESAGDFAVAIRLLALRAASIGLSRGVMKVMPHRYETESPFFDLVESAGRFARFPERPDVRDEFREIVLQCRISAGLSHARLEEQGVSSDLVFRLDLVLAQIERIEVLLRVITGEDDGRMFAAMLVRALADERGVRNLLRNSVNRVARQIVTHTGKSGEHYIAGSRSDWATMGYGAVGAGGITAFTALFKYLFAAMGLAPLWTGVAHSLNYTLSFVLMQFLGWSLASKMPSMTAAGWSSGFSVHRLSQIFNVFAWADLCWAVLFLQDHGDALLLSPLGRGHEHGGRRGASGGEPAQYRRDLDHGQGQEHHHSRHHLRQHRLQPRQCRKLLRQGERTGRHGFHRLRFW